MKLLHRIISRLSMKEVFISNDAEQNALIIAELRKNGIKFRSKVVNSGTQNRKTGRIAGQIGENIHLQIIYYIYVAKEDEMKARYLINKL